MFGLLLAAVLAGPPAPPDWVAQHQAEHAHRDRVRAGTERDAVWLGAAWAVDTGTTGWAIHDGAIESNPIGVNAEVRMSLKLATNGLALATCHELRESGHHRAATWIRFGAAGLQFAAGAWNARNALRGR